MVLKDILNNVLSQSGFIEKDTFTSAADIDDKQMISIANRVAYEIKNYFMWPELSKSNEVTLIEGVLRYKLPDDFQDFVPDSAWETDGSRQVEWPTPNNRWYMYKFSTLSDGGVYRVKKYGNEIELYDVQGGAKFSYEYISKWVVKNEQGGLKESFTDDADSFILDDQLLVLGIQAHWQQAKQMPSYAEHFGNYDRKLSEAIGRSSSARTIGGYRRPNINCRSPYTPLYLRG